MEALWLWIGVLGFAAATVWFVVLTVRQTGNRQFHIITTVITGWAALWYLLMATGAAVTIVDGRVFYYGRYVDWLITTPLLLLDLALLALLNPTRRIGFLAALIGLDVIMVLTGWLAGSRESAVGRGFWFIVSTAAFIGLLYLLISKLFAESNRRPRSVGQIFRTLAVLTIVLWSLYPLVWLLGTEGFGVFGAPTEVFFFLILDLLAKIGFGVLLLTNREAIAEATGARQAGRVS